MERKTERGFEYRGFTIEPIGRKGTKWEIVGVDAAAYALYRAAYPRRRKVIGQKLDGGHFWRPGGKIVPEWERLCIQLDSVIGWGRAAMEAQTG